MLRTVSNRAGTQTPNRVSLAQLVAAVPTEMDQPPMAIPYTRSMTPTKRGRARSRLVTTWSIRSERDSSPAPRFSTVRAVIPWIKSYLAAAVALSRSSPSSRAATAIMGL